MGVGQNGLIFMFITLCMDSRKANKHEQCIILFYKINNIFQFCSRIYVTWTSNIPYSLSMHKLTTATAYKGN